MLKVAYVTTYAPTGNSLAHERHVQNRERLILRTLASTNDWEVRGYGVLQAGHSRDGYVDGHVGWEYFPFDDDDDTHFSPHVGNSSSLVAELQQWQPDTILIKGLGTPLGETLMTIDTWRRGIIIGGRFRSIESMYADFVLTEKLEQEQYFAKFLPTDRIIRLNKLVDSAFIEVGKRTDLIDRYRKATSDVIVVGGLEPWKNHRALLPLAQAGLRLLIVGDGSLRRDLEESFAPYANHVTFTGQVGKDQLIEYLGASRLLCHPSMSEGFPRAIAEAMAVGLPVVAVDGVIGAPLRNGYNGLLTDEGSLLESVRAILQAEPDYIQFAQRAMATAGEQFSEASTIRAVAKITEVCSAPPVRHIRTPRQKIGLLMAHGREVVVRTRARLALRQRLNTRLGMRDGR